MYKHKRRAILAQVKTEPKPSLEELLNKQGGKCANCKRKGKYVIWHIDHIIPLNPANGEKRGADTIDNIQILCKECNQRKHNKPPEQWAYENGRLL